MSLRRLLLWAGLVVCSAPPGCVRERPNAPEQRTIPKGAAENTHPQLDRDAACVNLDDDLQFLACGPRVAEEARGDAAGEGLAVRRALEAVDLCSSRFGAHGEEGPYPPRTARCTDGPRHACVPRALGPHAWEFAPLSETSHPALLALHETGEYFGGHQGLLEPTHWHRTLRWRQEGDACLVDYILVADIDGDGRYAEEGHYFRVENGEARPIVAPDGVPSPHSIPEADPTPVTAPEGFVPLPDAGCEDLHEKAQILVCGPFKLQHVKRRMLDFREDNSLTIFWKNDLCFHPDFAPEGSMNFYPPLSMHCMEAPGRACRAAETPTKPWEYPRLTEADFPSWFKLQAYGFKPESMAYTSKQIRWNQLDATHCEIELEVKGDLDGDGVFGRYTTHATVAPDGKMHEARDPGTIHPE